MDYSVVIPFFNEEENISNLLLELSAVLKNIPGEIEIIAIDDGSTDGTLDKLKSDQIRIPGLRIISFEKRSSQSAALWAGIQQAEADMIITMDGDMQNDPNDIPLMLEALGKYDAVFGWRKNRKDPFSKRISSKIANGVRTSLLGFDVHDTGCGLKIMKKTFFQDVYPFKGMHRFFPSLMKMQGAQFTEFIVNHRMRKKGKTKYNVFNRVFTAFYDLLAVRWMQKKLITFKIKENT